MSPYACYCPPLMSDGRLFTDWRSSNLTMYAWARTVPERNPEQFRRWMLTANYPRERMQMAAQRQASCTKF
jgi:hypothetical protein